MNDTLTGEEANTTPEGDAASNGEKLSTLAEPGIKALDGFDPAIHAVDADGNPKRKPSGEYALKRGRKPGQTAKREPLSKDALSPQAVVNPARAAAVESAMMFAYGGVAIFGDEWKPKSDAEMQGLESAFERYYIAKGVTEFPPGLGLVMAMGAYALPRVTHDNTKTKLQKMAIWAKEKMQSASKLIGG